MKPLTHCLIAGATLHLDINAKKVKPDQNTTTVTNTPGNYTDLYIYVYEDDLQLGKLKENCLLLKLYRKLRKICLGLRNIFLSL